MFYRLVLASVFSSLFLKQPSSGIAVEDLRDLSFSCPNASESQKASTLSTLGWLCRAASWVVGTKQAPYGSVSTYSCEVEDEFDSLFYPSGPSYSNARTRNANPKTKGRVRNMLLPRYHRVRKQASRKSSFSICKCILTQAYNC
jgi:hypothetical protein